MFYNSGVASISAVLKKNHISSNHFAVFTREDVNKLLSYIKDNEISVVGFTITEPTLKPVSQVVQKIKKRFPNVYVVCGGLHAILDPTEVLEVINCDAVCIGEGEYATLKLVKRLKINSPKLFQTNNFWFRKGNKIIKNKLDKPIDINTLPSPNREIFYKNNYDIYQGPIYLKDTEKGCIVTVSRGCQYNCSFCGNQFLNTQYLGGYRRTLKPEIAIKQLKEIIAKRHYDYLIFIDPQFPTNDSWLTKFSNLYSKYIKIPYTVQLRFGSFTQKTVNLLKKTGCYFVQIGLESGDKDMRFLVLNKKIDHNMIVNGVEMFKKKQIKIGLNNMVGLPDETPERFINTIKTNGYINPDYSYIFIYYPYKGTELYKYSQKHNLIKKQTKYFSLNTYTTLKLKNFQEQDIIYYYVYYQSLLSIFKKSVYSSKLKQIFWKKIFYIFSISPTKRQGIIGIFSQLTENIFLDKNNHL